MLQKLMSIRPLFLISLQRLLHKILRHLTYILPFRPLACNLFVDYIIFGLLLILSSKRRLPSQQHMANDPCTPYVDLTPIALPFDYLRRHVAGSPTLQVLLHSLTQLLGKTKVSYLDVDISGVFRVEQDVGEFQVTVHD